MKFLTFALFLTLGLCGVSPDADEVTEEGSNISNALGALSALKGMADEIQGLQAEIENMEPTDSVHFSEILPVLPDPPEGWSADDADGSTTQAMGGFSMSQGSRTYRRDKKRVTVTVADWAYNKAIYMPFILSTQMSQETTKGYNKGIKVGEDPGRDEYNYKPMRGERIVLVGKRFPVTLKTQGLEPEEIDEWWKRIDTARLRSIE